MPRWLEALLARVLGVREADAVAGDLEELAARSPRGLRTLSTVVRGAAVVGRTILEGGKGTMAGGRWFDGMATDLRVALRQMGRERAATGAVVLAIALGVGATTAVFSVVDAALLRPLPLPDPQSLVVVRSYDTETGASGPVSPLDLADFRAGARRLDELAGWTPERYALTGEGTPEQILVQRFTPGLFDVLGVEAAMGRLPRPEAEEDRGTLALTWAFWTRRFGADPGIVGRTVRLDDAVYEVVGVLPEGLRFPDDPTVAAWMPLFRFPWEEQRWTRHTYTLGRLADGAGIEAVRDELAAVARRLAETHPRTNEGWSVEVVPAETLRGEGRAAGLVFGAVLLVLLIASLDVANLLLVRATERRAEWGLRRALGADRGRLVRGVLVDAGLHAVLGAALGWLLALGLVWVLPAVNPEALPSWHAVRLDGRVLAFTAALTVVVTLVTALAPALRVARGNGGGGHDLRSTGDRVSGRGRTVLSVVQVALAVVLTVGAGLLGTSLLALRGQDPGFRIRNLVTFTVELPTGRYPYEGGALADGFEAIRARVLALPGVDGAGWTTALPMDPGGTDYDIEFFPVDRPEAAAGAPPSADLRVVSPGYREVLDVPLLAGRGPSSDDGEDTAPVAVVNRVLAERWFPGEDPVGRELHLFEAQGTPWRIIGVVEGVRHRGLDAVSRPEIWVPARQMAHDAMTLVVRTGDDPASLVPALRAAVAEADPGVPLIDVATMEQRVDATVAPRRFGAFVGAGFAALGVVLALVGVQGTLAYTVSRRTKEIGVRMALGADRGRVLRGVLADGIRIVGVGTILGVLGALAGAGLLESMLFGVTPRDPATLALVVLLVGGVALVACWVPAARATRVDPLRALHQ